MIAVYARLIARYLAGALLAYGMIDAETSQHIALDPDVALVLSAVLTAATEGFYKLARKYGWAT
jgi:hypothetical protein